MSDGCPYTTPLLVKPLLDGLLMYGRTNAQAVPMTECASQPTPRVVGQPRLHDTAKPVSRVSRAEDRRELDELHRRLDPVVRRVLWTLLGPNGEFDDIAHDVFVRILQGLARSRPDDLERWAARVAINTAYNALRRKRYRKFASWDPQTEPDVLVWNCDYESRHVARRVAQVFSHMPRSEQALLERRWFGATIEDLATEKACSSRTIKRRVRRALARFELCARRDPEVSSWLEHRSELSREHGADLGSAAGDT